MHGSWENVWFFTPYLTLEWHIKISYHEVSNQSISYWFKHPFAIIWCESENVQDFFCDDINWIRRCKPLTVYKIAFTCHASNIHPRDSSFYCAFTFNCLNIICCSCLRFIQTETDITNTFTFLCIRTHARKWNIGTLANVNTFDTHTQHVILSNGKQHMNVDSSRNTMMSLWCRRIRSSELFIQVYTIRSVSYIYSNSICTPKSNVSVRRARMWADEITMSETSPLNLWTYWWKHTGSMLLQVQGEMFSLEFLANKYSTHFIRNLNFVF